MYFAVFGTGISYMLKLVAKGPNEADGIRPTSKPHGAPAALRRSRRPID